MTRILFNLSEKLCIDILVYRKVTEDVRVVRLLYISFQEKLSSLLVFVPVLIPRKDT